MHIFTEKSAENFLEKEDFIIINRTYIEKEHSLKNAIEKIGFPLVMKVAGKKIIHKNKLKGIVLNIKTYEKAVEAFNKLKKIKGFEGIIIQSQIQQGKEFLLGIKKTPEFGHVLAFGAGGIHTEELKDVSFRVCPFDDIEAEKMIQETKISKTLKKLDSKKITENIINLCKLIQKYPKIKELDINPLIVNEKEAIIVDARIVWE